MKLRMFSNYASSEHLHQLFNKAFEIPANIEFTADDDYTHAIVINHIMPDLKVPPSNVVGLAFEPWCLLQFGPNNIEYIRKHVGRYLCGEGNRELPFFGHYPYMDICCKMPLTFEKPKLMSIIFSTKRYLPGHNYRHLLVSAILKYNLPIDIYGRGCKCIQNINDPRIKGEFTKYEPYHDYMFTIAIENSQTEHYITEKLAIPLVSNTTPLYWGATKCDKYFPNMTIKLTGKMVNDLKIISDVLQNPNSYRKPIDQKVLRDTINPFKHLDILFPESV